jgi:hypothetical protein
MLVDSFLLLPSLLIHRPPTTIVVVVVVVGIMDRVASLLVLCAGLLMVVVSGSCSTSCGVDAIKYSAMSPNSFDATDFELVDSSVTSFSCIDGRHSKGVRHCLTHVGVIRSIIGLHIEPRTRIECISVFHCHTSYCISSYGVVSCGTAWL